MSERTRFTSEEARQVGERIGIDWSTWPFGLEQFPRLARTEEEAKRELG